MDYRCIEPFAGLAAEFISRQRCRIMHSRVSLPAKQRGHGAGEHTGDTTRIASPIQASVNNTVYACLVRCGTVPSNKPPSPQNKMNTISDPAIVSRSGLLYPDGLGKNPIANASARARTCQNQRCVSNA